MPQDLPYLPSYKNVQLLFEKIAAAKTPEVFTHRFLTDTLGLKSTGDRALISLLKTLGFLDSSGKTTPTYGLLKNKATAAGAIAEGIRKAYEPLFSANEKAHELPPSDLKGLISQVAGADENMTTKILGTFNALVKSADFKAKPQEAPAEVAPLDEGEVKRVPAPPGSGTLQPGFYYNLQIHLPSNGSEETYLNIFNALRKAFK